MSDPVHFDLAALFDVDEYLYFMEGTLRDEDTPAQCDFIERVLNLPPGGRVLDLGCGHGRHSLELARRGHRPLGLDLVPGFIERARADAARAGLAAEFVCADLRTYASPPVFDAAICLFDAFGFHTDDEHARILDNILAALHPGAGLLLDVRTREHMLRCPPVQVVDMPGGDLMVDRFQFDIATGRMVDRRSTVRAGRTREITFSVRLYAYTELRALLVARGFEVLQTYGGFDGAPLSAARPRTLVVARKPLRP